MAKAKLVAKNAFGKPFTFSRCLCHTGVLQPLSPGKPRQPVVTHPQPNARLGTVQVFLRFPSWLAAAKHL
jgi:hypothetical protein